MKRIRYLLFCGVLAYGTAASVSAQKITPVYNGTLRHSAIDKLDSVKKEFSEMLNYVYYCKEPNQHRMLPYFLPDDKRVTVTPDSVSFNLSEKLRYTFLCANQQEIKIVKYTYVTTVYIIYLTNLEMGWKVKNLEYAKKLADDFVYFQHMKEFVSVKGDNRFDSLAIQYRALKVKPVVSEDERRYIVQANAMTQAKNYNRAIELYEKAIVLNPTNPMVYNNEALLLAIVGQYHSAINRMKKYLLLVPEADDARAAQDKIYEWEAEIGK
jgi:tetratricopeptide (TPR) repeat protein